MNDQAAPIRIANALPLMTDWARSTVLDIQSKIQRFGSVSPRTSALLWKLVEEVENKSAKPAQARETIDLSRINEMFDKASQSLKRPFVCFLVEGIEMKVSPAPATGKNPGSLYVKKGGEYQGKIGKDGGFTAARDAQTGIVEALKLFALDPARAAFAYGQATGNCCFCARELTDARSVEVGYGPICAGNYGLPWGV